MRRAAAALVALALIGAMVALIWPRPPLPPIAGPVERIVIDKSARQLQVIVGGRVARSFRVSLGFAPEGDKRRQGDGRTPEGLFQIDRRNGESAYHLSLGLNYPRPSDRARAAAEGVDPGGDIFIHGQPNLVPDSVTLPHDWTAGCIALSNAEIEVLWQAVPLGTPVEIRP